MITILNFQKLLSQRSPLSQDKKKVKEALKLAIKDIENQKAETSVVRAFGSNVSLATRNKNRLTECFEPKVNAIQRTEKKYKEVSNGKKRSHDHTGPLENFVWEAESCLTATWSLSLIFLSVCVVIAIYFSTKLSIFFLQLP